MAVFLGENGELAMGNKTPVTILQEILQKKGLTPHYELIYNGTGTLDPVFKFQVSAEGMSAIGDGKSKKQAKHDAAASLLKRMLNRGPVIDNGGEEVVAEIVVSPYDRSVQTNFVGRLEEICVINKIPFPVYMQVGEEGPPHARIFTMKCQISSISETATARTKKQAKHLVAQQMIQRVEEILDEEFLSSDNPPELNDIEEGDHLEDSTEERNRKAIESGTFRHSMSTLLDDLQNVFHHKPEEFPLSPMFMELPQQPEEFYKKMEDPIKFLTTLVNSLGGIRRTVEVTQTDLQEALVEINQCYMNWDSVWEEEEDELAEEEFTNEESEESKKQESENCCLDEVKFKPQVKYDLSDSDSDSSEIENLKEETDDKKDSEALDDSDLEDLSFPWSVNKSGLLAEKACVVILILECPQGKWSFYGCDNSKEEAESRAAVRAILFLRRLSVPTWSTHVLHDSV